MKSISLFLTLASIHAFAGTSTYVNFLRQNQQGTAVVWDMPVAAAGAAPSALSIDTGGSLFQLWTVDQTLAKDYLLDQKLVGAYLPKADIKITTLDTDSVVPRTRVDKPFTVKIDVAGLLTGTGLPEASTKVLLERHIQNYATGQTSLDPAVVAANTPLSSAYLTQNGSTVLNYPASSLKATDPTKATGEEHFIVHALSDGTFTQTQIASAKVQVYPIASGSISGIVSGTQYRYQMPTVQLNLYDLYPRSDTYLMLYEGTQYNGVTGTILKAYPWNDPKATQTTIIMSDELNTKITKDGTYTIALMSQTVYGMELLATPVTFSAKRTIAVNAMQVNFSDGSN
ncbi:MAG: hypothetical protein ABIS50_16045 [Luteolibacter sp.]|uniref:hypothetical protein n=1 Tax=Luteolibacter sp. TaxID=1962973 RepID=UPI003265E317